MKLKNYPNYVESYELKGNKVLLKRLDRGKVVYERVIGFNSEIEARRYYDAK